ncbi:hypothetical protein MRV_0009 [Murid herpesvirus 3]|uniref:Uncharacterized protein n=2 Tax=Murid betaherpesvirus 3 TaxID=2560603 RepID=A0A1P8VIN5_9BETA|nr:hypothetical protein MRV_0009 [Murine roseolovirus]APZ76220.1 hypothetical protein MRV_0009 [Murid betaherpesvirus 3]AYH64802.1 hypothetical protein MRV_0009 [Murid herpesvirus 3]
MTYRSVSVPPLVPPNLSAFSKDLEGGEHAREPGDHSRILPALLDLALPRVYATDVTAAAGWIQVGGGRPSPSTLLPPRLDLDGEPDARRLLLRLRRAVLKLRRRRRRRRNGPRVGILSPDEIVGCGRQGGRG